MNSREAVEAGLKRIEAYAYGFSSNREDLKERVKEVRKKYNIRAVMVASANGSGHNKYTSYRAYVDPILFDYFLVEDAEKKLNDIKERDLRLQEEYSIKRKGLEEELKTLHRNIAIAKDNIKNKETPKNE